MYVLPLKPLCHCPKGSRLLLEARYNEFLNLKIVSESEKRMQVIIIFFCICKVSHLYLWSPICIFAMLPFAFVKSHLYLWSSHLYLWSPICIFAMFPFAFVKSHLYLWSSHLYSWSPICIFAMFPFAFVKSHLYLWSSFLYLWSKI